MSGLSDSLVGIEGLGSSGRVSIVTLNGSGWTALPTTALSGRASILVQNQSGGGLTVLINYSNAAPAGEGIQIPDGGFKGMSVKDNVIVYGRMASGAGSVAVEELA